MKKGWVRLTLTIFFSLGLQLSVHCKILILGATSSKK